MSPHEADVSEGALLGGRVRYRQPVVGYRTGIEPVLLAASVPARPGQRVVEAGTGAGAGLLSLAARVRGLTGAGLERDPAMAALAAENLAANEYGDVCVLTQDVTQWQAERLFDHAFANPPWHTERGTRPSEPGRLAAKFADDDLLLHWAASLASGLRARGTLSLVLPAAALARGIVALIAADCPQIAIIPLWPRAAQPARLMILRGVRLGRGPTRMLPGLVLHNKDGSYTHEARRILWDGAPIP